MKPSDAGAAVALIAAGLWLGGCSSREMKGTPFYTGEYELNTPGAELNRVNLWPLAYYREPALSVLWPVFEHTEEHVALRPLFSAYGDSKDTWEYNLLWPLCQADTRGHDYRIFPLFWGEGRRAGGNPQTYHVLFPFGWHYEDETCSLFPLWLSDRDGWSEGRFTEHDLWLAWPLIHVHDGTREQAWHAALFGRYRYAEENETYTGYPWPMLFSWQTPDEDGFFSPLYTYQQGKGKRAENGWSVSPPLLSWHTWSPGDDDYWALGPLLHYRTGSAVDAWHAALIGRYRDHRKDATYAGYPWPLFFSWQTRQEKGRFTPFYASQENREDGSRRSTLLPLLSWHAKRGNDDDYWLLGPLLRYRTGDVSEAWHVALIGRYRDLKNETLHAGYPWPLFFTWQTPRHRGLFTPLYAAETGTADEVRDGWAALPPLLSWHLWKESSDDFYALLGLFREHRDPETRSGHLLPVYAYDRQDRLLFTPLVGWDQPDPHDPSGLWYPFTPLAGVRTGHARGGWLFPLFSHTASATNDTASTRFLLLGYARHETHAWRSGLCSSRRAGFFPLFSRSSTVSSCEDEPEDGCAERAEQRSRFLLLQASRDVQALHRAPAGGPPAAGTNRLDRMNLEAWQARKAKGDYRSSSRSRTVFPIWSSSTDQETRRDGALLRKNAETSLLFFLYDVKSRFEAASDGPQNAATDEERRRILWRLWHYERRGGDVSVDLFPAITYDRHADGFSKTSFLWRLYRYERHPGGGVDLDLLFLPLSRAP